MEKRGITGMHVMFAVVAIISLFIVFAILPRAPGKIDLSKFSFTEYIEAIKGIFTGTLTIVGYEHITFWIWINHMFALVFATILCAVYIAIFNALKNSQINILQMPGKNQGRKRFILQFFNFKLMGIIFLILLAAYHLISFVPVLQLLKPLFLPLYSDYGYQLQYSYETLIAPLLYLLGKTQLLPSYWTLAFWRGFMLSWYVFLIYLVPQLTVIIPSEIITKFYEIKAAKAAAKANLGAQRVMMGQNILASVGKQAERG